jgi:phosphoribosylaminoimidazolecarboxamide formyltransferase/IMP cyclohydrolase
MRRALLSVYDKTGIAEFARSLVELGWSLYASSGTFRLLRGEGIEAEETAEIMGYPNLMGGRVKTLHPAIFGGILARRENPADMKEIDEFPYRWWT